MNHETQLDFLGPLPVPWGANKYLLTCIDRFSKFPSVKTTTRTTVKVIQKLLENCIDEFCTRNKIKVFTAPMGQHRATRLVERLIPTVRDWLMACSFQLPLTSLQFSSNEHLYIVLTITDHSSGCSPFEAHFG